MHKELLMLVFNQIEKNEKKRILQENITTC